MKNFINNCSLLNVWQDIDIATARLLADMAKSKFLNDEDVQNAAFVLGLILRHCFNEGHVCITSEDAKSLTAESLGLGLERLKRFNNGNKNDIIQLLEDLVELVDDHYQLVKDSELYKVFPALDNESLLEKLRCAEILASYSDVTNSRVEDIKAPLVYSNKHFYISRSFWSEKIVAQAFKDKIKASFESEINKGLAQKYLKAFFSEQENKTEVNWQKVSVAMSLCYRLSVITGGPGTGKTTSVAKLVSIITLLSGKRVSLALAAPTGKAADRMRKSFLANLDKLKETFEKICKENNLDANSLFEGIKNAKAKTLHSLLGVRPGRTKTNFNENNKLPFDILIIDEASMIDLSLMFKTIRAIDFKKTRVVFLGDKDQLSSVEAGAVLGDICSIFTKKRDELSPNLLQELNESVQTVCDLTGYSNKQLAESAANNMGISENNGIYLAPGISTLLKSYRFKSDCGIGLLASKINVGNGAELRALLQEFSQKDITKILDNNKINNTKVVDYYNENEQKGNNKTGKVFESLNFDSLFSDTFKGQSGESRFNYYAYLKKICEISSINKESEKIPDDLVSIFAEFNKFRILVPNNDGVVGVNGINKRLCKKALELVKNKMNTKLPNEILLDELWFPGLPYIVTKNDASLDIYNGDIGICHFEGKEDLAKRVWFENGKSYPISLLSNIEPAFALTIHKSQGSEFDHTMVIIPQASKRLLCKELFYTAVTRAKNQLTIYGELDLLTKGNALEGVRRFSFLQQRLYSM